MVDVPTFDEFMGPTIVALRQLGGSATIEEIYEAVVEKMGLTDEQLEVQVTPHGSKYSVRSRMGWARTYLRKADCLTNSARGVWALTQRGQNEDPEPRAVVTFVKTGRWPDPSGPAALTDDPQIESDDEGGEESWRDTALAMVRGIPPAAFERLCQRVLRECGFVEVEVTGRSGDGGIDGRGILRLQRVVSFQVLFQCKRYQGSVGPHEIRDFRGAMIGRSDKGLFITTGTFTRGAHDEATRDGAPPIDLIDGNQFVELLKDLQLGVHTELVEVTRVETDWFHTL